MYVERTSCRVCGGDLELVLSLGMLAITDFLPPGEAPEKAPLDLMECVACGLVQLGHTVSPERLYSGAYWYRSGVNEVMIAELGDVVTHACQTLGRRPKTVLDIGSNDGTLLSHYPASVHRVGVEPCLTLAQIGRPKIDYLATGFFPGATAEVAAGSFDIVTSIAMFYDVDDPHAFVAEVDRILARDGVWIIQLQDLLQMVQKAAFDNICHEHLLYYTPLTLKRVLDPCDLEIKHVSYRTINGGSLRLTIRRKGVGGVSLLDDRWELPRHSLDRFSWRIGLVKQQLVGLIEASRAQGREVDLYAASTKANTLLQYCGLDHTKIRRAAERSPEKVGRVTTGTNIPIVSEATWRSDPAPLTLIGAWQFADAFQRREHAYLDQGGAFLIPLPRPEVICEMPAVSPLRESGH